MCRLIEEMLNEAAAEAAAEAKAEGIAEGKAATAIEVTLKLLAKGRDSMEEIAEMTGLSLEEVRKLAKKDIA